MAASRPLSLNALQRHALQATRDEQEQNGAQIIDLSAYFTMVGSQLTPRPAQPHSLHKANDPRKLQGKAVRFFQGQQELLLTNKH